MINCCLPTISYRGKLAAFGHVLQLNPQDTTIFRSERFRFCEPFACRGPGHSKRHKVTRRAPIFRKTMVLYTAPTIKFSNVEKLILSDDHHPPQGASSQEHR